MPSRRSLLAVLVLGNLLRRLAASCACNAGASSAAWPPSPWRCSSRCRTSAQARLTDVSGYDLAGVASTGLICFFAFVGWENAAFSGEEFADPRTLVKALGLAVAAVGALFVLLGITVVGGLSRAVIATSDASLADLARLSLGAAATGVAAVIALVAALRSSCSPGHAARTRLIYALAREGLFPRTLARVDAATRRATSRRAGARRRLGGWRSPSRSSCGIPIETYIQLSSGNFLLTYVLIVADRVAAALRAALPARAGHLVAGDSGARRRRLPEPLVRAGARRSSGR